MTSGLDIARSFFEGWGRPTLEEHYPQLVDRVAAVICGRSQSLGHDDELSRDHDWGPQFSLVLLPSDMSRYGRSAYRRLNELAPREWDGWRIESGESVEVSSLNKWFRKLVNCEHPPATDRDWYRKLRSVM